MEPLKLIPRKVFTKVAQEAQLPNNEAEWPSAILGELYKQAPYIEGNYVPEIMFKEKSPEEGAAIGMINLQAQASMGTDEAAGTLGDERGARKVQIPFIVRQFKLAPLDLLVLPDGEFRPQNKQRMRDAMFRPGFTDGTARGMRWNTWLDTLDRYPMGSLGQVYLESMNAQVVPYEKMSALMERKSGTMLMDLAPLEKEAFGRLVRDMNDPFCQDQLRENPAFLKIAKLLTQLPSSSQEKEASLADTIPPTVIQVTRRPGAVYLVKKANPEAFEPVEKEMNRAEALGELGSDVVSAVDNSGMATISTSPAVREELIEEKVEPVKDFGLYRVKAKGDGRQLVGWVFPKVVDLDGVVLPMTVFNNGSENTVQKSIAGVRAGAAMGMIATKPHGIGIFYRVTGNDAVALTPLVVDITSKDSEDTTTYDCTTLQGQKVRLHSAHGAAGVAKSAEGEYVMPADMKFMPLPNEQHVELIEEPDEFVKTARLRKNSLTIYYDREDQYTLRGCGIDKLAEAAHIRISPEDALFLATAVGLHPELAIVKLAKAREVRVVTIPNLKTITPLEEKLAVNQARLERSGFLDYLETLPKPIWLVKEAAVLGDVDSVDKILSLGFINPHNIGVFLSYAPDLERTQAKVCELLFGSRIGNDPELESAAERTMHGIESILSSLRLIGLETTSDKESV